MRSYEEIIEHIEEVKKDDFFGTQVGDLVLYLPWEKAKQFFRPDSDTYKSDGAEYKSHPKDREAIIAKILDYMPFAWEKANDCKGLSACRSMDHMQAWLWMLGEDELVDKCSCYNQYGKPQLQAICEKFGWDHKQWDNGYRGNTEGTQKKIDE